MIVEVLGIHEHNKGAMLMLESIRQRLADDLPEAKLAINVHMSKATRQSLGLLGIVNEEGGGVRTRAVRALPRAARRKLGLAIAHEVDVILDASGFSYGDYWGLENLKRRLVHRLRKWRRPGRVAVMLPQALGPFTSAEGKQLFAEAVSLVDHVFVRDRQSMEHVAAASSAPHVTLAPDFTGLLHPSLDSQYAALAGAAFIIPNEKVVTGRSEELRAAYLDFLQRAAECAIEAGNRVLILVHEGEKDARIARELNERMATPLDIVDLPSTLQTKALIGQAQFVIGSRFHGIVSALTSGVPPLVVGWSHKYEELLADYAVPEFIVDLEKPEQWSSKITNLLRASEDKDFRARLLAKADEQRASSEAMWSLVIDKIRSQARA
jgi:polysaccharide pyruvyl transferase WcaK-like protein